MSAKNRKKWMVVLPWGEYHNLVPYPVGIVIASIPLPGNDFDIRVEGFDRCYGPLTGPETSTLTKAFRDLSEADWTPNQRGIEKDENARTSLAAKKIIEGFPLYPGSPG